MTPEEQLKFDVSTQRTRAWLSLVGFVIFVGVVVWVIITPTGENSSHSGFDIGLLVVAIFAGVFRLRGFVVGLINAHELKQGKELEHS